MNIFHFFIFLIFLVGCIHLDLENLESNQTYADTNMIKDDTIILDVRTPEEFEIVRLKDAINLDFYESEFKNKLSKLDRNKNYLVYCRSGHRSAITVEIMDKLGFTNVKDLEGGINKWYLEGKPTVSS